MKRRYIALLGASALLVSLIVIGCSGHVGNIPFQVNPAPKQQDPAPADQGPPLPNPGDPHTPVTIDGREYWFYDTDGDGIPDWIWDPRQKKWGLLTWPEGFPGFPSQRENAIKLFIDAVERAFTGPEPALAIPFEGSAEFAVEETGLEFVPGVPMAYSIDIVYFEYNEGTPDYADVRFFWSTDCHLPNPGRYGSLASEIYMNEPDDPNDAGFLTVRVAGELASVAGYLLDCGAQQLSFPWMGSTYTVTVNATTRAIYVNGILYGYAPVPQ